MTRRAKRPADEVLARVHSLQAGKGKIAAIEPDTGEWFVGRTLLEAVKKGRAKCPDKIFYTVRIGSPYAHQHKGGCLIMNKISFKGIIVSVQPRIRLMRSFDERSDNYLGYSLFIKGMIDNAERGFSVGIGKAAQATHQFKVGDEITGECLPVADERVEPVEFYKASKLKKVGYVENDVTTPPPWKFIPPELEVYRERGYRRLAARTYDSKCTTCVWGCRMPVEIIIDHWNPGRKEYRFETFCYGPLSCKFYKAGPTRKVPGRKDMVYEEEDWVDEEMTRHRGPDE